MVVLPQILEALTSSRTRTCGPDTGQVRPAPLVRPAILAAVCRRGAGLLLVKITRTRLLHRWETATNPQYNTNAAAASPSSASGMVTDEENSIIERMIEEGKNAIAIRAAVPEVSRTNVYLKIAKFKKHGTVGRVQTKTLGRPRVMSEGVDKFLQGLLAAKPDMELEEMRRHIQDQLHVTVSMSTISRAITRAGMANGRPGRARLSARRKNKAVAAAEAGVVAENHQPSAPTSELVEPNDHAAAVDETTWERIEQSTLPAHHLQQNLHQQPQHMMMQIPHHQVQSQEMHVLDPSLAQAYQVPAPYHSIYADMSRAMTHTAGMAHTALGVNTGPTPNMEAYRSPYAPI